MSHSALISVCDIQVLDKYGDIYGRERIAELLGMDLASLDVSAMTHEKKPEPDTSMFSWYALFILCFRKFHEEFYYPKYSRTNLTFCL